MPKNQSTAAQTARRASRSGGKYTEALRRAKTSKTAHAQRVLRFLAERSGNLYYLVGGIAAAWAHSGQRVLLLEEAEDYWRWTMSGVGRSRGRRKKDRVDRLAGTRRPARCGPRRTAPRHATPACVRPATPHRRTTEAGPEPTAAHSRRRWPTPSTPTT
ncbi:hypothetical protein ACFCX0_48540 [Streptomyces sp. NPDC056352]|uniref:hypothetical protein n=1 Tax=Streptomyces sp. NPDC056352 TaxID=3345791 RepID=UPI0035E1D198